jgi:beta-glucanase (GH16 family)
MRNAIRALTLLALAAAFSRALAPHGAVAAEDAAVETLSSQQKDFVFEVRKGQGGKVIKGFDARGGQKIRLVGFGSMSLDQLRAGLRVEAGDALLDLGNKQQLRIVGANADVISAIQIQLDRSPYAQTFADDFDALSLDLEDGRSKGTWRTNFGYGGVHSRTLPNNAELQVYSDRLFAGTGTASLQIDPFKIADGKLEIVSEPLKEDLRKLVWDRSYTSGLLTTKASFSQTYGLFEIRAKLPKGKGLWPAFWLLPQSGAWPPEIDVLEVLGDNTNKLYVSWHSNVGGKHTSDAKAIDVPDMSADFHTYSVVWEKDRLMWFFDDVQVASRSTPEDFHLPMYMLINLAVGGGWPGSPDKTTQFPARYTIDWVRAYARRDAK